MTYSTLNAINEAIEDVIIALTPADAHGRGKYVRASTGFYWENRPATDKDRRFSVDDFDRTLPTMFGAVSEVDYEGTFVIRIGHVHTADKKKGMQRRDTDLQQIKENLEKKSNFPTGVSLIRFGDQNITEADGFWLSVLTFSIWFALAAP